MTYNGVIDQDGNLIRAGYCDFEPTLLPLEAQVRDIPFPGKTAGDQNHTTYQRWTGRKWEEVEQLPPDSDVRKETFLLALERIEEASTNDPVLQDLISIVTQGRR